MTEETTIPNLNETTPQQGEYYRMVKDQTEVIFQLIDLGERLVEKIFDSRNPDEFKVYKEGDMLKQIDGVEVPFAVALKAAKSNKADFLKAFSSEDYPSKNVIRKDSCVERRVVIDQVEYIFPMKVSANRKLNERLQFYEDEDIDPLTKTFKLTKDTTQQAADMYDVKVLQVKPSASVQAVADIVAPRVVGKEVFIATAKEKDFVQHFRDKKIKDDQGHPLPLTMDNLVEYGVAGGWDESRLKALFTEYVQKQ